MMRIEVHESGVKGLLAAWHSTAKAGRKRWHETFVLRDEEGAWHAWRVGRSLHPGEVDLVEYYTAGDLDELDERMPMAPQVGEVLRLARLHEQQEATR